MGDHFDQQKTACLAAADLSRKVTMQNMHSLTASYSTMQGSIDSPIVDLVEYINKQAGLFTLSSCSGRLVLLTEAQTGVGNCNLQWCAVPCLGTEGGVPVVDSIAHKTGMAAG